MSSFRALLWTVVLLFLVIYVVAVWLTELVADYRQRNPGNTAAHTDLARYWGSLGTTLLTLFQSITSGVDWEEAVSPLHIHISPIMSPVYALYIAFASLALMNIVTGVFVESALSSARTDKDYFVINGVRELFAGPSGQISGSLTWKRFETQLQSPLMREYFRALNVDPSEAEGIFRLLDLDDSGSIDAEEFLHGCLRLHGPAKALDLALVMHELRRQGDFMEKLDHSLIALQGAVGIVPNDVISPMARIKSAPMSTTQRQFIGEEELVTVVPAEHHDPMASDNNADATRVPFAPVHEAIAAQSADN
jgi:hypothetical protein